MNCTRVLVVTSAVIMLGASAGRAAQDKEAAATADARKAGEVWLAKLDGGKYGEIWDEASATIQNAVTKDQFTATMQQLAATLGKMQSRTFQGAKPVVNPPGAPAGEYVGLKFDTVFEIKGVSVEWVTLVSEGGTWRVAGYHAEPPPKKQARLSRLTRRNSTTAAPRAA